MKITYLADIRLPTEKAHGLQIMKTCAALAKLGHEITLLIPSWNKAREEEIFTFFELPQTFLIRKSWALNTIRLGPIGFRIRSYLFSNSASRFIHQQRVDKANFSEVIYTRDEMVALILSKKYANVYYEIHDVRKSKYQVSALKNVRGIVSISNGLKIYCLSLGINANQIAVIPDAVDMEKFTVNTSKDEARKKTNLPLGKKIILYSGHLYSWKGADVLAQAAQNTAFSDSNTMFVFVGGTTWDIKKFKTKYGSFHNIKILGHISHSQVPPYLKAADVLVLPNSAKEDISRLYTSPIKLFEYMASGTPIVASDLPSIREILNENNATFSKPDDVESLTNTIKYVLDNAAKADILSHRAASDVKRYTWEIRASEIERFITGVAIANK